MNPGAVIEDVKDALRTISLGADDAREVSLRGFHELVASERTIAYRLLGSLEDRRLDFMITCGFPSHQEVVGATEAFFRRAPERWTAYDHRAPAPKDRNHVERPMRAVGVEAFQETPVAKDLLRPMDLHRADQLRVILCDGPRMLAWFGAMRHDPFDDREQQILEQLAPALHARYLLDTRLEDARSARRELAALIETVAPATFVATSSGRVRHASASARALLDRDREGTLREVELAVRRGTSARFSVQRVVAPGTSDTYLLMERRQPDEISLRAALAARRWGLSPRQEQVMRLAVAGLSNREIATALECTVSTVEVHMTALLDRAGADSRSSLVARLWSIE